MEGSAAATELAVGDVITEVDGRPVGEDGSVQVCDRRLLNSAVNAAFDDTVLHPTTHRMQTVGCPLSRGAVSRF